MLHFLDPKAFPSMEKFLAKYRKDESGKYQAEDIMRLREKIKPYLLKRDKEDVDLELPEKEETVRVCPLLPPPPPFTASPPCTLCSFHRSRSPSFPFLT